MKRVLIPVAFLAMCSASLLDSVPRLPPVSPASRAA